MQAHPPRSPRSLPPKRRRLRRSLTRARRQATFTANPPRAAPRAIRSSAPRRRLAVPPRQPRVLRFCRRRLDATRLTTSVTRTSTRTLGQCGDLSWPTCSSLTPAAARRLTLCTMRLLESSGRPSPPQLLMTQGSRLNGASCDYAAPPFAGWPLLCFSARTATHTRNIHPTLPLAFVFLLVRVRALPLHPKYCTHLTGRSLVLGVSKLPVTPLRG
mmetsp:Transcript_21965/g.68149  ORF Transcript_21965/g.68149 Transcript_21965/m.68149 type:complete len:215 (-) Transcript_21965:78-722(-)